MPLSSTADAFLAANGFAGAAAEPVAADWSARAFWRVTAGEARAILMHWPDGAVADLPRLARLFADHGVRVAAVLAVDAAAGLALMEDVGLLTAAEQVDAGAPAAPLMTAAVDLLIALHRACPAPPADVPRFDAGTAAGRAARFCDWYLPSAGRPVPAAARDEFLRAWETVWPAAEAVPLTLVHYDFHLGNMIAGDGGLALIDFQDAVAGPVAFDLACLLQDVRRDYDPALLAGLRDRYLAAFPALPPERLDRAMAVIGAQRATQILGNLGRARIEGRLRPRQRGDIARAWARLERNLDHPVLAGVKPWYDRHAPPESRRPASMGDG